MASSSSGSSCLGLTDNQKRWLVIGIALNKILVPQIRPFVEQEVDKEYNNLKTRHNIHTQSTSGRLQRWPPRKILKYENINGNSHHPKLPGGKCNFSLFDCRVLSHIDFAKLYVEHFMAKFNAFDDQCDASAVLKLLGGVPVFSAAMQAAAGDVRNVRNDWAHCDFSMWDPVKFQQSFFEMEHLVRVVALRAEDEAKLLAELKDWETKGTLLCMNSPMDPALLQLVQQKVKFLQDNVNNLSVEFDQEKVTVQQQLQEMKQMVETLKTFQDDADQRFGSLETRTGQVEGQVHSLEEDTAQRFGNLETRTGQVEDQVHSLEEDTAQRFGNLETRTGQVEDQVHSLEAKFQDLTTKESAESNASLQDPLMISDVNPGKLVELIRRDYKGAVLCPFPWCEDELQLKLSNIFTRLQVVSRTKERSKLTNNTFDMTDVFKPHPDCDNPRVVLIEGNPGMGKTTYCQKLAYDWSVVEIPSDASFPKVNILLLLKCRDMHMKTANIEEAIDDQLLPQDAGKKEKEDFFQFIRCNQSRILLVLDGLDELRDDLVQGFLPLIQGKLFASMYLILTSRHEAGMKVRRYCDTLLEIIGYSKGDVESYIKKYFSSHKDQTLADKMIQKLNDDRRLKQLTTNPLNTALLCLLCEETRGEFPSKKTKLYNDLVACALRRFFAKRGIPLGDDDPVERCSSELNQLGRIAFETLLKHGLYFSQDEVKSQSTVDFLQLPFLSREPSKSKIRPTPSYAFTHRTFQEYFAAFYLAHQLLSGDKGKEKLLNELDELSPILYWQVWEFLITQALSKSTEAAVIVVSCLCDFFHRNWEIPPSSIDADLQLCVDIFDKEKCDSVVIPLTTSREDDHEEALLVLLMDVLRLIAECEDGDSELKDYQKEVVRVLARRFPLEKLGLVPGAISNLVLSEYLKFNCSLTTLCLVSEIDTPLLSTTIKLVLHSTKKGVKFLLGNWRDRHLLNQSLAVKALLADVFQSGCFQAKKLGVHGFRMSDEGCQLIGEFLQTNCTLSHLRLTDAEIYDGGATAIGDALQSNFTLTHLSLPRNMISGVGAAAIATGLQSNPVLTYLDLSQNAGGGESITMALAQALKSNCALKYLDVCDTFNALENDKIGPRGRSALARALRFNRTLTHLNLKHSGIDDSVASALGEALQTNSALMDLNLADNQISETGTAALGKALQSNYTLTHLNLEKNNGIGDAGAKALGEALQSNHTLIHLNLESCKGIGDTGAVAIAKALQSNDTLTHLNLGNNNGIGDTGAEALGKALQSNHTLTHLNLMSSKRIGDTGAVAIAKALQASGTRLTMLDLRMNSITCSGATAIAEALHTNTSLTHLYLRENRICCDGASAFAKALKTNCTLTHLHLSANGIGDLGATELALALKDNNTLRSLSLGENCLISALGRGSLREVDWSGDIVWFRPCFVENLCNCIEHRLSIQE